MRISDWSSDVCSSDLLGVAAFLGPPAVVVLIWDSGAIAGLLPVLGLFVAQSLLLLVFAWLAVLRPHRLRLADIGLRPAGTAWNRIAVAAGLLCVPIAPPINQLGSAHVLTPVTHAHPT